MNEEVRHFSLRKLSIGLASVLVGVSVFGASQTVKADTVADQNTSAVTNNTQSSDTQENKNVVESSFSNDNQANNAKSNLIQTQVEGKNEQKQAQAKNIQQDSASKTQETTDSNNLQGKSAEKDIARTSSLQESNNQSNTVTKKTVQHDTLENLENGQKAQSFNLPKNSQKFNRKVLATNLSETASSTTTNGGFDEATWGKLDVTKWQGSVQDGVYQLTGYTGDKIHIIVPNEADFEKAGKSTNGLQVGITRGTVQSLLFGNDQVQTIAFSKTNNQKIKAIGTDWSQAFAFAPNLSKLDGSNLDVSNVTNMSQMFEYDKVSDLTSLAHWNVSNVTNMSKMFEYKKISDLTPLAHWNTSNVTNMSNMFSGNKISNLTPLANWKTGKVTNMSGMFEQNSISNLTGLANWNVSNVTDMSGMFEQNSISDLTGLAKWNVSNVTDMSTMFSDNKISNLTPLTNWNIGKVVNMGGMFSNSKQQFMPDGSIVYFDGNTISDLAPLTNWDVSNVTDMSAMFSGNKISDLAPLTNWDVSNVTDMSEMFFRNKISDLTGLAKWDTSNVTDMSSMFGGDQISDLSPLTSWNTGKVTSMNGMFDGNQISNLSPLTSWNTGKVTSMNGMFGGNPDLINLRPIANWNMSSVSDWGLSRLFSGDTKLDLTNINNTPLMQSFLKKPSMLQMLQGATFIINNVDLVTLLVKGTTGKDAPILTNTAKRTIVFNFPDGTSKTVTQTINYRAVAPVQVNWPAPPPPKSSGPIIINEIVLASLETPASSDSNRYSPKIIKTYPVKESDWQLDTSKPNDDVIIDGVICFKPVKIPHVNGYKAYVVPNKLNPASFTVSFMAVPTENKPATPAKETSSKPSASTVPTDHTSNPVEETPSKPSASTDHTSNSAWTDLDHKVVNALNQSDSGWTMPENNSTYKVDVPTDDATIDLSDLVIAQPIHAHTHTQIRVNKHFKLRKHNTKRAIKHLKHRKRVSKLFSKRYALL